MKSEKQKKLIKYIKKNVKENDKRIEEGKPVIELNLTEGMRQAGYAENTIEFRKKGILNSDTFQQALLDIKNITTRTRELIYGRLTEGELSDNNLIKLWQTGESIEASYEGRPMGGTNETKNILFIKEAIINLDEKTVKELQNVEIA